MTVFTTTAPHTSHVQLLQRSVHCFELVSSIIDKLVCWLLDQGYHSTPACDRREYGPVRSLDWSHITVVYFNRCVLAQGRDRAGLAQRLSVLVVAEGPRSVAAPEVD
ncbi:MAG: hypothetical protein GFH27_549279n52 [Chloroflexi bacterium AL-W]|nr:hypothetical protein [Chloroflexi bacterium AL-N1]NOK71063.1 hypothetical protein [Chloroflexi bacterium AL-N10]NOK72715.1 hypothetical protein [Chloroflexi bacterium AL-N5]NOK79197.1 hypothetical protein [Chloroflexi bacterium AL-W]NOK87113.1 hypothetical protein [Chloroflexi bacterium AL-N15]